MSDKSGIQWTEATWNPVTGCSKVSQGCKNCYALRDWPRLSSNPRSVYHGREFTDVRVHTERFELPLRWTKPRRIFVNSMSDLFHEKVPRNAIETAFATMARAKQHVFQILTKRPERMLAAMRGDILSVPLPNVWLGVSVEDQATADERIPLLLQTPAAVRFVSYEPALAGVDFVRGGWSFLEPLRPPPGNKGGWERGIDWLIVGGESGPGARPCDIAWIRSAVEQCKSAGVPVFVKQLGARPVFGPGPFPARLRHGDKWGDPDGWPEDLRVREFPR